MIRCENPGGNTTIVKGDRWELCFSYGLLVAVWDRRGCQGWRTAQRYSVTTSRHVNRFEAECGGRLMPVATLPVIDMVKWPAERGAQ